MKESKSSKLFGRYRMKLIDEKGRLFGKVTAKEIADAVSKEYGLDVNKKKITLEADIKSFGTFAFDLKLHTGVSAKMNVQVVEA
jgi:large subunit ribosomal protein L9